MSKYATKSCRVRAERSRAREGPLKIMGVDTTVKVPIADLLAWWRRNNPRHRQSGCKCGDGGVCGSNESLGRALGVSHSTLHRRIVAGEITMAESDQWARTLRVHPANIWRGWDRAPVRAALGSPSRKPFGG